MGEKSGSLFNILVVVAIATILIAGGKVAYPAIQDSITNGFTGVVDNEFSSEATE